MKYTALLLFAFSLLFVSCQSEKEKAYQNIISMAKEYNANPDAEKAKLLDSAYKSYTAAHPRDTATPHFLFEDARLHLGPLQNLTQAVVLFDQIYTDYPDHERAPIALFNYAYVHENMLGNETEARKAYHTFLEKYPKHELADDAQKSIDNLGKTPEEILKGILKPDSAQIQ